MKFLNSDFKYVPKSGDLYSNARVVEDTKFVFDLSGSLISIEDIYYPIRGSEEFEIKPVYLSLSLPQRVMTVSENGLFSLYDTECDYREFKILSNTAYFSSEKTSSVIHRNKSRCEVLGKIVRITEGENSVSVLTKEPGSRNRNITLLLLKDGFQTVFSLPIVRKVPVNCNEDSICLFGENRIYRITNQTQTIEEIYKNDDFTAYQFAYNSKAFFPLTSGDMVVYDLDANHFETVKLYEKIEGRGEGIVYSAYGVNSMEVHEGKAYVYTDEGRLLVVDCETNEVTETHLLPQSGSRDPKTVFHVTQERYALAFNAQLNQLAVYFRGELQLTVTGEALADPAKLTGFICNGLLLSWAQEVSFEVSEPIPDYRYRQSTVFDIAEDAVDGAIDMAKCKQEIEPFIADVRRIESERKADKDGNAFYNFEVFFTRTPNISEVVRQGGELMNALAKQYSIVNAKEVNELAGNFDHVIRLNIAGTDFNETEQAALQSMIKANEREVFMSGMHSPNQYGQGILFEVVS